MIWIGRIYRFSDILPILALSLLPFAYSPEREIGTLAIDIPISFFALSFAFSINDLFDSRITGESNNIGRFSGKYGRLPGISLSALPAFLSILLATLFGIPTPAIGALLAFLLVFFLYSAEFPRARDYPGPDFVFNILGYFLLLAKSHLMHFKELSDGLPGLLASSVFLISFCAVAEAIHELAHEREDRASGRKTLFALLGRKGAVILGIVLVPLPIIFLPVYGFWHTGTCVLFSALRLSRVISCKGVGRDYSSLRKRLFGREELLAHLALFLIGG